MFSGKLWRLLLIILKSNSEIENMKKAAQILKGLLSDLGEYVRIGVTTKSIDNFIERYINANSAICSFKNYRGYPACSCISVNDTVVHGLPSDYKLKESDVVSIDVGVYASGYHADAARTYILGEVDDNLRRLVDVAEKSFFEGLKEVKIGGRIGDISNKIQRYVESNGFNVIREFYGHGIGRDLHEDPIVSNYGKANRGPRIQQGMALAIEPMICTGSGDVVVMNDGWTAKTVDGSVAAHYENTIVVTYDGPTILTV
jgi:methionyl aminopeptidase